MPPRTYDWFLQAERDLAQAEVAREAGHHDWACFALPADALPNGFPEGAPFEYYGPRQSEEALDDAREIFGFVRAALA